MNKLTLELPFLAGPNSAQGINVYLNDTKINGVTHVNLEEIDVAKNEVFVTLKIKVNEIETRGIKNL